MNNIAWGVVMNITMLIGAIIVTKAGGEPAIVAGLVVAAAIYGAQSLS